MLAASKCLLNFSLILALAISGLLALPIYTEKTFANVNSSLPGCFNNESQIYVRGIRYEKQKDNNLVQSPYEMPPLDVCLMKVLDADTENFLRHELIVRVDVGAYSDVAIMNVRDFAKRVISYNTGGATLNKSERVAAKYGMVIPPGGMVTYEIDLRNDARIEIGVNESVDAILDILDKVDEITEKLDIINGIVELDEPGLLGPAGNLIDAAEFVSSTIKFGLGETSEATYIKELGYLGLEVGAGIVGGPVGLLAMVPSIVDGRLSDWSNNWFFNTQRPGRLIEINESTLQSNPPTPNLPYPVKVGDVVKWDGDSVTSWFVTSAGERKWIPTGGDFLCFQDQGAKIHSLSSGKLDQIEDQWGEHAKCSYPDGSTNPNPVATDTSDTWEEPDVPQQLVRNRSGQGFLDFNGDGKGDIFHANGTKWKVVYSGKGGWVNINTQKYKLENLAFGDFNGDGKTDVFRANGSKWLVVYGGKGGWIQINTSSIRLDKLAFGDFDGDGKTDVFRSSNGTWYVSYSGKSNWAARNSSAYGIKDLAFGDFDGDGLTDVFRAHTVSNTWYVVYGAGGGWSKLASSSYGINKLGFADFNGDGKTDVVISSGSGPWQVVYGGKGGWQNFINTSYNLSDVAFSDLNGNGKADVFRTHWSNKWYVVYDGSGGWKHRNTSSIRLSKLAL